MHFYYEHDFSVHAALLHVDSLAVSDITNISAKFEWTHIAKNNIHHIKFKVCNFIIANWLIIITVKVQ